MILGVDFDNTLVCYDGLFHAAAVAWGLMPEDGPKSKEGVRDWLIQRGREDDFTRLQGEVYGPGLRNAKPYPGALDCLRQIKAAGAGVCMISHKTPVPVMGPPHDLRQAAWQWLESNGFLDPRALGPGDVFFEDTMEGKATRIGTLRCTHFVDDMERFLSKPYFPRDSTRILFLPGGEDEANAAEHREKRFSGMESYSSWRELAIFLAKELANG